MNIGKQDGFIKDNNNFYKDGFFELPCLYNSPQVILQSVMNSPSAKHVEKEQAIYTNNPFSTGIMRYREIEEGFWIIATKITFSKNVMFKAIYDKDLPIDYYMLTFSIFESEVKFQNTIVDKTVFPCEYWGFNRPESEVSAYFYEGSTCEFYLYGFSKEWAKHNLSFETLPEDNEIKKFLTSDEGFVTYRNIVPNAVELSKEILINLEKNNQDLLSKAILKTRTFQLISTFFKNASIDQRIGNYSPIEILEYEKIAKAEKLLIDTITNAFLGIEYIAEKVGMSPTKLKLTFKLIHGISMMQYHKEKKLLLAMQLIQDTDMQIKNIALATGYKSSSKFTANFKKRFGKMPSEICR